MPKTKRRRVHRRVPPPSTPTAWRWRALSMLGGAFVLFAFVAGLAQRTLTSDVHAQLHVHDDHATGQPFEPLLDGTQHAELIPDEVAIRALMQTLRIPPNPDTAALRQLHARIDRARLSAADRDTLAQQLGVFEGWVGEEQARIEALRPTSADPGEAAITRYVRAQEDFGAGIVDHYQQLLSSLSPDGAMKMQDHLQHVKSRIRIYPTPDMSARID